MRSIVPALLFLVTAPWAWGQSQALDACSVLTREEIAAHSSRDPGPPEPNGSSPNTTCQWGGADPIARVALYEKVDPKEPNGLALKQLVDRGLNARAIDELGDDAVFLTADDDTPAGTMFVRVDHWRVVITWEAEPQKAAESTLPTLTALAKAAIAKLHRAG